MKCRLSVKVLMPLVGLLAAAGIAQGGDTERVSVATGGLQGNGESQIHVDAITEDGRYIAFTSTSTNLVPDDSNGFSDVFVYDRITGSTERVSVNSASGQADGPSEGASISGDGRYVSFASDAGNLVAGDSNSRTDVFVHDRVTGTTVRVSVSTLGAEGNGRSPENSGAHVSADGRFVVFPSIASNLVAGDANGTTDVFIRDLVAGTTELVSRSSAAVQGNGPSAWPHLSGDGRYVGFTSLSTDLVPGDTNGTWDIFVHDRLTGATERVSVTSGGVQANLNSGYSSLSDDGRYVAFFSYASNLVPSDTNGIGDIFVHDRQTGLTERVSVASDGTQGEGPNVEVGVISLSSDGARVVFYFSATNLVPGDTNGAQDVFLHNRLTGETMRVSVASDETQGNASSTIGNISGDGTSVAFQSSASNLVAGDTNARADVFVHDLICDPARVQFQVPHYSGPENAGAISVSVTLCGPAVGSVSVDYASAPGTATPGSDYTDVSGTITFADGELGPKTFTVPILDDVLAEPSETVQLALSNVTGNAVLGSPSTATLTILDCEQTLQLSGPSYSISENEGSATITVTRTGCGAGTGSVSVDYATAPGTATPGSDYTAVSGTLTFADGELGPKTFTVPILDDLLAEPSETVQIALSNVTGNAVLGSPSTATLTILDCEQSLQFSGSSFSISENGGSATITVTRTGCGAGTGSVSVDYATAPGTATSGSDYTDASGTITFADGELGPKSFVVPILDDLLAESSETVQLALSNVTGNAVLGSPSMATLTILDCEQSLQFLDSSFSISETGGAAIITVTRIDCGPWSGSASVDYATAPGTATPGADYTAVSGTLTFAEGQLSAIFTIPIINDADPESDETLILSLSNPTPGVVLGLAQATLIIMQSGSPPGPPAPKIAMHIRGPFSKTQQSCKAGSYPTDCRDNRVTGQSSTGYYVYILVAGQDTSGVGGLQLGIEYDPDIIVMGWSLCATGLEFPTGPVDDRPHPRRPRGGHLRPRSFAGMPAWPVPGSGNRITWRHDVDCPTAGIVPVGHLYLYAYAPSQLSVTPWPLDWRATVVSCRGAETVIPPTSLATVGFGGAPGCNPCQPVTDFPPPGPCSVEAQPGEAILAWNSVPGASHYRIYREGALVAEVPEPETTFSDQPPPGTYRYEIRSVAPCEVSLPCSAQVTVIGVPDVSATGGRLRVRLLSNPARRRAEFVIGLESTSGVRVETYDILGRRVSNLEMRELSPGEHTITWDGRDDAGRAMPAGIYFTRIHAGSASVNSKFLLLR